MAAVPAHEATGAARVLVAVRGETVAAAAGGGFAELLEFDSLGEVAVTAAGGVLGLPEGEAGDEDFIPEKDGEEEDGAAEAVGGDLDAEARREEEGG